MARINVPKTCAWSVLVAAFLTTASFFLALWAIKADNLGRSNMDLALGLAVFLPLDAYAILFLFAVSFLGAAICFFKRYEEFVPYSMALAVTVGQLVFMLQSR
jgi:hypothetical protein